MTGFYSCFAESAERWPQNIAIEVQREHALERYTYAELRRMAESVGRTLSESGVRPGARCSLLGNNSARWVAAYLGVITGGCVAVPLDTAFKPKQIATLLKDSGATVLFVDERYLANAREATQGMDIRFVLLEGKSDDKRLETVDAMFAAGPGKFRPLEPKRLDEPAVILYTSGTTSDPKGVVLTHGNLLAEVEAVFDFVHIQPTDSILGVLPLFHSLAQMANLLLPFAGGARVVYLETLNTTELLRGLAERDVTLFCCVPQFFYLIHDKIVKQFEDRGPLAVKAFRALLKVSAALRKVRINIGKLIFRRAHQALGPHMRYIVTGGSRFDVDVLRDFYALGFNILQAYGLTEVSGGATATPPNDNVLGSVGRPLKGVEVKLFGEPTAVNGDGHDSAEVALRGRTVMQGYYNRPDANALAFRDGWFLTGDLGYIDEGGNVFITGRAKEVIVLANGKNIYPEEIEQHYLQSPWIKEICVVGLESKPGERLEERLHAVVVPNFEVLKEKRIVNINEVIRFDIETLSTKLPPSKRILSYEIWKEELPRTTTRKLKRFEILRKVEAGEGTAAETRGPAAITADDESWMLRPQVAEALGLIRAAARDHADAVAPGANLELDLGLDSMERVELMVGLEKHFNAHVPDALVSEVYTVRELVEAVLAGAGQGTRREEAGWDKVLATESDDPDVLALAKPQLLFTLFWFLFGQFVNLFTRDFFNLKVEGIEKLPAKGPYILSPNHQSFIEAPVLVALVPWTLYKSLFYVGTSEIFGSGLFRWVAKTIKLIPVDPDANLVPAMRAGAYGLRHGRVLVLYPEGERSITGEPKVFKKGAAILATHLQVPIYPVAVDGFFEAWPRGKSWFQKFTRMRIKVGDPIVPPPPGPKPELTYAQVTAELKKRVMDMWVPMHRELYPEERSEGHAAD